MRKIAVTGRLGAGKSTVCRFFRELGAQTVSADTIVHQLLSPGTPISRAVESLLGSEIVVNGIIDRNKVAHQVFKDPKKLRELEAILHPAVRETLQTLFQEATQTKIPLIIVEVPLLFEAHLEQEFDTIIAVTSTHDYSQREDRAARRERMLPESEIVARSHYQLSNEGSLELLKESVHKLYNQLLIL